MRYLILSDIHGSATYLQKMITLFEKDHFDYMILLGDILYHGPRNPLPEGHDPQGVVKLLNPYASKIIACRGNCDAEVDQMLLAFPCLNEYAMIVDEGIRIFATHGHLHSAEDFPKVPGKQIFLYGHTHLWELRQDEEVFICNPGSVSLPKENRPHTYATYDNGKLCVYDFNHAMLATLALK